MSSPESEGALSADVHESVAVPASQSPPPESGSTLEKALGGSAPSTVYAVKLPLFEGPLDLLLHLIRLNEVEITEIPIARVAEQYIVYLELMHELNLDVAGEYLVMAATLAWIKSRMLLPVDGIGEDDEGPDPRAELVARLLDYQRYKEAAGELGDRPLLGRDTFSAIATGLEPVAESDREIEVNVFQLVEAFRSALKRAGPSGAAHEVEAETVTVLERMIAVMETLEQRSSLLFDDVFALRDDGRATRAVIVTTFLAILELARLEALRIYQSSSDDGAPEGPLHLRPAEDAGAMSWRELIADIM